jgi:hypothetical protein
MITLISLRLDAELLKRLNQVEATLRERSAGVPVNRSGVLRLLLEKGLTQMEAALHQEAKHE